MNSNYEQALKWYAKAANMGNAEAQYKLGKILVEAGKLEDGERCLRLSAKQGNKDADELLAKFFGECLVFESPKQFSIWASKRWDGVIEYSLDRINWQEWNGKKITSKNNVIYMLGYNNTVITGDGKAREISWCFEGTSELICRGNIEVLLDYRLVRKGKHLNMKEFCYAYMFSGCTSLKEAPDLPATKLARDCYSAMFSGCTSLKEAPALPAIKLAKGCYAYMFSGCTSLKEAPDLPATKLADACYSGMFSGCTSLKEAPDLPATKLALGCYSAMFSGCTSLKEAPKLPATKLAPGCYGDMFYGCASLKEAPALPATELVVVYCYSRMFYGCTSLKEAPELPATKLSPSCYSSMFSCCTSLEKVPELSVTKLKEHRCSNMFDGTRFEIS